MDKLLVTLYYSEDLERAYINKEHLKNNHKTNFNKIELVINKHEVEKILNDFNKIERGD